MLKFMDTSIELLIIVETTKVSQEAMEAIKLFSVKRVRVHTKHVRALRASLDECYLARKYR